METIHIDNDIIKVALDADKNIYRITVKNMHHVDITIAKQQPLMQFDTDGKAKLSGSIG